MNINFNGNINGDISYCAYNPQLITHNPSIFYLHVVIKLYFYRNNAVINSILMTILNLISCTTLLMLKMSKPSEDLLVHLRKINNFVV